MVDGKIIGDATQIITGVAPVQSATPPTLTFLDRADRATILSKCRGAVIIVPQEFFIEGFTLIQVAAVIPAFEKIVRHFSPPRTTPPRTISKNASIATTARIGKNVRIDSFVVIEDDVEIGDDCTIGAGCVVMAGTIIGENTTLFPNAVLHENTVIGKRCSLHANAVIGSYGFGYTPSAAGHVLCPQFGNVILGDDVEVGAGSTIDRATYGSTEIQQGTKIDNQVMIGHNCNFGKHNLICAHSGIAGSTTTGDFVVMAGRVGIKDHVHIGNRAVIGAMAGIITDIPEDARVVGIPATPEKEQLKIQVNLARLPEMRKEFKALQNCVAKLSARCEALEANK